MAASDVTRGLLSPAAVVRVPQDVVYRPFAVETVVLNLKTGLYHSVNPTGGRMLEVLDRVGLVRAAAEEIAGIYGQPVEDVLRDVCAFCFELTERGLIEVERSDD